MPHTNDTQHDTTAAHTLLSGHTQDLIREHLRSHGYAGALHDMMFAAMRAGGLTGSLTDMIDQTNGDPAGWFVTNVI